MMPRLFQPLVFCAAVFLVPWGVGAQTAITGSNANATVNIDADFLTFNSADVSRACGTPRDVTFSIVTPQNTNHVTNSAQLKVWWGETTDACNNIATTTLADESASTVNPSTPGTQFDFPADVSTLTTFTELDILTRLGACPTGVALKSVQAQLCIGVNDESGTNGGDRTIDPNLEFSVWITFEADTVNPSIPNVLTVTPLDGALDIDTALPTDSGENGDIALWQYRYRVDDGTMGTEGCDTWADGDFEFGTQVAQGSSLSLQISDLTNGNTYAVCVAATDDAGNLGDYSPIGTGTPRDECDFLECYPGGMPTGYCGATGGGAPMMLFLLLIGLVLRRWQQ